MLDDVVHAREGFMLDDVVHAREGFILMMLSMRAEVASCLMVSSMRADMSGSPYLELAFS